MSLSLCAIKRPKEKAGNWFRGWWRDTKERDGVRRYVEEGNTGFDHWWTVLATGGEMGWRRCSLAQLF